MTTPTERGLFEQIQGWIDTKTNDWSGLEFICKRYEQQLAASKEREEATRKANLECVDMYNQIDARRKELEQQLFAAREEAEGLKLVVKELVRDIEITHENIRQGKTVEITQGSLGRLKGAREALTDPLPEKNG